MRPEATPRSDGFQAPAEFDRHRATAMCWPVRPGSWGKDPARARRVFLQIYAEIAKSETLYVLADPEHLKEAETAVSSLSGVFVLPIAGDDAWVRDTGPTFVRGEDGRLRGVCWRFNAWGGLYQDFRRDQKLAEAFCEALGAETYDAGLVLEGGSVHVDGEGTALVTESCLLNPNRNPSLTKEQIERKLCAYLGVRKVLWLPGGLVGDETGGHVDNLCAFLRPGEVVLAWAEEPSHPQYGPSAAGLRYLEGETDAKGRRLLVHKLPVPDVPLRVSREEAASFSYAPGEAKRREGERLPASYVNFYFTNKSILVPQFGGENRESDARAVRILQTLCPGRRVVGILSRTLLLGGGNIHCLTQQIPAGFFTKTGDRADSGGPSRGLRGR